MGFFVTGQWSNPGNMMDTQICATQKCWWIRGWNALLTPGGINTSLVLLNQTVLRVISRLFKSSWWIGAYTSGSVATLKTDTSGIGFPDFPNHSPAPHSCSLGSLPSFELSFQICLSRASRIRHVGLDFSSPSNTVYTINHQLLLFGVFFFFFVCTHGMRKFPGQGSNVHSSSGRCLFVCLFINTFIEMWFIYQITYPFKMQGSLVFSVFTELCNYQGNRLSI